MAANDSAIQNGTEKIATNALTTVNGTNVSADLIEVQVVKAAFGSDGVLRYVDAANGLPVQQNDVTSSGSLAAAAQTVVLALNGQSGASVQIAGTWVGTITFEASNDNGTTWNSINATASTTSQPQPTTTVNGLYRLTPGGLQQIRAIMTAFTSGSASVSMRASAGVGGMFANQILPIKITDGTNTATIKAASTAAVATDLPLVVTVHPSTATQPVTAPALTKGTQGANGFTTQDLKDAGRNAVHYYMVIPILTSATDTLQSLTGTKAGATVAATTTPAVVTAGKTLRITRLAATYIATATSGYGIVRLRFNTGGVVAITSPIAATLAVGSGTPASANSCGMEEAGLADGWEFAAGTGIGVSAQGFAAATATAVGYVLVSVTGYEY